MSTINQKYLTISQAAKRLGVSKSTLLRWEKSGIISSTRTIGDIRRYLQNDIDKLHKNHTTYERVTKQSPVNYDIPQPKNKTIPSTTQISQLSSNNDTYQALSKNINLYQNILKIGSLLIIFLTLLFCALAFIALVLFKLTNSNSSLSVPFSNSFKIFLTSAKQGFQNTTQKIFSGQARLPAGQVLATTSTLGFSEILDNNFNLTVAGDVTGKQLNSTTTSEPPFTVANDTKVIDLNSDLLDGMDWDTARFGADTFVGSGNLVHGSDNPDLFIAGNLEVTGAIFAAQSNLSFGFTSGSIVFQGSSALSQDNTNLYWDDSNNRLGIGDNSPASTLTVGSGDAFQVSSTGDILKIKSLDYLFPSSHTTNGLLLNNGSGTLTWSTIGAASITADSLDFSEFKDSMSLDATTTFGLSSNDFKTSGSGAVKLENTGTFTVTGDTVLSADLAINGDDITSDGALTINATTYTRIGDSGSPGTASGDDDLYVEGDLEVDGTIIFDTATFNCTDCMDFDDLEDTLDLDAALTLNQTTNTWSQTFTGTTATGLSYAANSLTTGTAMQISSTSTAGGASGSSKVLDLSRSGTNSNATHTAYGLYSAVTNTGTTSTNVGGYFSASGATNNYAAIFGNGNVGIGDTSPTSLLTVGSGDLFQVNSSGVVATTNSTNLSYAGSNLNLYKNMGPNATSSWSTGTSGGTGRVGHTSVLYNNKIYSWGGINSTSLPTSVDIYDIPSDTWSTGTSGGTARYEHESVVYNGKIYSWGGYNGSTYYSSMDIYDIASDSWSTGTSGGTARISFASNLYNGKIYYWGGYSGASFLNTIDIYDIASDSWSTGTSGGTARYVHTSALYNGKIYFWAGYSGAALNSIDIYDIASDSWSTGTSGGTARHSHSSMIYNGKIYSWAGVNNSGTYLTSVDIYDIASDSWSTGTSGGTARRNSTAVGYNGKIYFWAGQTSSTTGITLLDIYDIGDRQTMLTFYENDRNTLSFRTGNALNLDDGRLGITGGRVGIGTTSPTHLLHVSDSQSATVSATIENTSTGTDADGLAVKLGFTGTGTTTNSFITFLNGSGKIQGKIHSDGANGVTYKTTGIDFAEYFTKDGNVNFSTGDLVSLGTNGAILSSTIDSLPSSLLGIVSSHPGFVGGEEGPDKVLVGLMGQVPVKIASNSAEIQAGDPLTSSDIPGKAVKATTVGEIVGRALENWDSNSGKSTIMVALNVTHWEPDLTQSIIDIAQATITNLKANLIEADQLITPIAQIDKLETNIISPLANSLGIAFNLKSNQTLTIKNDQGNIVTTLDALGNIFTGKLTSDGVFTKEINSNIASISGNLNVSGDATISGTLFANNIVGPWATMSAQLDASTSALLTSLLESESSPSASLNLNEPITLNSDFKVLGNTVLGQTSIAGSLLIDGVIKLSSNGIESITDTFYIQKNRLAAVDILNGTLNINANGSVIINGDLKITGKVTAKSVESESITTNKLILGASAQASPSSTLAPTVGESILPKGEITIIITNTNVTQNSLIFLTLSSATDKTLFIAEKTTGQFTVGTKTTSNEDIKFNWWIIN